MDHVPATSGRWVFRIKIACFFGLAAFISTIVFWYFFIGLTTLNQLYEALEWTLYSASSALLSSLLLSILFDCFRQDNLGLILIVSAGIVLLSYPALLLVLSMVNLISTGSLSGMRNAFGSLLFVFFFTSWITFPMGLLTGYLIYRFE